MADQKVRRVIAIDTKVRGGGALNRVARDVGKINKNVSSLSRSFNLLKTAAGFAFAGIGVRQLTRFADEIQLLQDRLKVFSGSTQAAKEVFYELVEAAKFTKTSVAALGTTYVRVALAAQELGLSSKSLLATTVALQQSFRLAGATIAEARAATIQLSQGLSSGQLRGQELRSVMEQNAILAGQLAGELKITRGALIKFAEQGKITSEVVLNVLAKNFRSMNKDAQQLGQTFEQSMIIALDAFKVKIGELNKEFGLNTKFAKAVEFFINNFDKLGKAILSASIAFGAAALAQKIAAISKATITFNSVFALTTKIMRASVWIAIGSAIYYVLTNIEELSLKGAVLFKKLQKGFLGLRISFNEFILNMQRKFGLGGSEQLKKLGDNIDKMKQKFKDFESDPVLDHLKKRLDNFYKSQEKGKSPFEERLESLVKALEKDIAKMGGKFQLTIGNLNARLRDGVINLSKYREEMHGIKIEELNKKFREGKVDVFQYHEQLAKFPATILGIEKSIKVGLFKGMQDYVKSVGTLAEGIAGVITNVFKNLENQLVDFIRKGELEFSKFVNALLDDLARLVVRQTITAPLAKAITGAFATTPTAASEKGNIFNRGNIIPFQSGGIINNPITFPLTSGTGLAGEKGPEAIIPLERSSDGKLGVKSQQSPVNINIVNQAGVDVTAEEQTRSDGTKQIQIMVRRMIRDSFDDGTFDKQLRNNFGVNRKGA